MTQAAKNQEIVTKPGSELSVVDLDVNSAKIAELAHKSSALPADLKDEGIYRETQDIINQAREMRSTIKSAGKALKDDAIAWQKKVVAEEKRLDGEIVDFLDPLAARKKAYDDEVKAEQARKRKAEQARKDTHLTNINNIRLLINEAQYKSSAEIENILEKLSSIVIDDSFEEYKKEAGDVYEDTELALNKMLVAAQNQEAADRKRAEEDERLRKEREALAADRAENERIAVENQRIAEENRRLAEKDEKKETPELTQDSPIDPPKVTQSIVSSKVQKKIDEDNSVVAMARKYTIQAIEDVIGDHGNTIDLSNEILDAIIAGKIPNVKYDIY